jgi:hypothetical protein
MSEDIRKMIDKIKNFKQFVNESEFSFGSIPEKETPTMIKLIKTAERDGYLTGHEGGANYVMDAAKKVAKEWDELDTEQKIVFRDSFYQKFLKLIHKAG